MTADFIKKEKGTISTEPLNPPEPAYIVYKERSVHVTYDVNLYIPVVEGWGISKSTTHYEWREGDDHL